MFHFHLAGVRDLGRLLRCRKSLLVWIPVVLSILVGLRVRLAWSLAVLTMGWSVSEAYGSLSAMKERKGKFTSGSPKVSFWPFRRRMSAVEARLAAVRFEFTVLIDLLATDKENVGLRLRKVKDKTGGFLTQFVMPDGLVGEYNEKQTLQKRPPSFVQTGDRLIAVNSHTVPAEMMREMKRVRSPSHGLPCVEMLFSRDGADAAPLISELEMKRRDNEPWGLKLEKMPTSSVGTVLLVRALADGSAVDRWNRSAACGAGGGTICTGDWIMACDSEVRPEKMFARMAASSSVNFTVLRWHAAKAEDSEASQRTPPKPPPSSAVERSAPTESPKPEIPAKAKLSCKCCNLSVTDKYVKAVGWEGQAEIWHHTCWGKCYGGFTHKHVPEGRWQSIRVYRSGGENAVDNETDGRMVHSIFETCMSASADAGKNSFTC